MRIALKEWAAVVAALAAGKQTFLLRKGGIAEGRSGFQLEHSKFVFYPTWEHQHKQWIQPRYHELFESLSPGSTTEVVIEAGAEVAEVHVLADGADRLRQASDQHIWNEAFLEMRAAYRPDLPLYVVIVRAFALPKALTIPFDRRYRGCRSWVELATDIPLKGRRYALNEGRFAEQARRLREALGLAEPESPGERRNSLP